MAGGIGWIGRRNAGCWADMTGLVSFISQEKI